MFLHFIKCFWPKINYKLCTLFTRLFPHADYTIIYVVSSTYVFLTTATVYQQCYLRPSLKL